MQIRRQPRRGVGAGVVVQVLVLREAPWRPRLQLGSGRGFAADPFAGWCLVRNALTPDRWRNGDTPRDARESPPRFGEPTFVERRKHDIRLAQRVERHDGDTVVNDDLYADGRRGLA